MLPKKIYLNYVDEADEDKTWSEEPVSVYDCKMQNREYTDLSQVWHDASEEPKEDLGKDDSVIIYQDKYGNCWFTTKREIVILHINWECFATVNIKRWAYITDLLPKGGEQ